MKYQVVADSDIGITKKNNQDSVLVKLGEYEKKEVLMAIICDGMGGLSKGEVASASVISRFSRWFDSDLAMELRNPDFKVIAGKWEWMLMEMNQKIMSSSRSSNTRMGTTFTGILMYDEQMLYAQVGDSRLYHIGHSIVQMTEDQTLVQQEINQGKLSESQARNDPRRNVLTQCVGASAILSPVIRFGPCKAGTYMICSDGLRHENTSTDFFEHLRPALLADEEAMSLQARDLIENAKSRKERDNISVVVIKASKEPAYD